MRPFLGNLQARDLAARTDAVVVDGDPGQLRQVLANLLRNALVHTPPATAIEIIVGTSEGAATLAVRDLDGGGARFDVVLPGVARRADARPVAWR